MKKWIHKGMAFLLVLLAGGSISSAHGLRDDPSASSELKAIADADSADRKNWQEWSKLSAADSQAIAKRDAERLARVRFLLQQGAVKSAEDFDNASLILQHGLTADDFLTAHELALIHLLKSPRTADNTFCLSEDRCLRKIGHRQRFGSQGPGEPKPNEAKIDLVEEDTPTAVTDALRVDLFMPPLSAAKTLGFTAVENFGEQIVARARQRNNAAWIKLALQKPSAKKLESLAKNPKPDPEALSTIIALYRADRLEAPQSYRHVAQILLNAGKIGSASEKASRYLLAHELAAVAAIRGDRSAVPVALQAMDLFLLAAGQGQRYGTQPGKPVGVPAGVSVRTEFGLSGASRAAKG